MRVTRVQSEENRQAVINAASRLFRERGFDGIGLNDLMKAAGLTHGGFYKKFKSKEDLAMQACTRALDKSRVKWARVVVRAKESPFAAIVRFYLSPRHRDNPGDGCAFAALGADAGRLDHDFRQIFETELEAHLDFLDNVLSAKPDEETRNRSIAALSTMVGALVISRAVNNPLLSERFLKASADAIIAGQTPES
ncbi:TetR/AcrR family transcriptional regulator [Gluconacetobacter sp. Hr-1-5]|uniref:TetR/AcrR family transcriptional regulator n=1 Tax=Gluconacetobacter sp. Hr-1-5 TaxID=3395370 RepID=UPI003B524183